MYSRPLILLLTLLLTLLLIGESCAVHAAPPAQIDDAAASTIARIRARDNTLVAGVKYDFPPFGYIDESGNVAGFDVDLMRAMAELWGADVKFVQVTSANRIAMLAGGEVDIVAASMTHTRERDTDIDFSQTYFLDGQSLLVPRDGGVTSLADLSGGTVAAIQGSTSIEQIQQVAELLDVPLDVLPFQEYPQALAALKAGQIDALTTDSVFLRQMVVENPDLAIVGGRFTQEPYAFGVRNGDSYFRNLVDYTLQQLKVNGAYDDIYRTWFPGDTPYPLTLLPGAWPYTLASSPTTLNVPVPSRVAEITTRGRLIVGVKYDFPPFGFIDEEGIVSGFDVDIARALAEHWLGDADAIELVRVTSDNRIPLLAAGEVDLVIASMTHKHERDDLIDFSQTYFLDGQSLLVRTSAIGVPELTAVADLDGKLVAAIDGSTSIENIQSVALAAGIEIELLPFQEYPPALEALKAGQVDALTTDSVALARFAGENPGLAVVGGRFTQEPYGIGLPNFDSELRDLVNFTLQQMKEDGVYDAIYARWFAEDTPYAIEIWPGESALTTNVRSAIEAPVASSPTVTAGPPAKAIQATPSPWPTATAVAAPTSTATAGVTGTPSSSPTASTVAEAPVTLPTPTPKPGLPSATTPDVVQAELLTATAVPKLETMAETEAEQGSTEPMATAGAVDAIDASTTGGGMADSEDEVAIVHTVVDGEYLVTIAKQYYGTQALWTLIFEANRDLLGDDPSLILPGQVLVIPPRP